MHDGGPLFCYAIENQLAANKYLHFKIGYDADIFNGPSINYHFKNVKQQKLQSKSMCLVSKNFTVFTRSLALGVLSHWQKLLLIAICT